MYRFIMEYNADTRLAEREGQLFILKRIALEDVPLVKALMQLNSPNIVRFFEPVTLEGAFWAVEEYISGMTLQAYLERYGALDDTAAVRIALGICNGLREIHRHGIVHRDITPGNIMLDTAGTVKIIDFGISRTYKRDAAGDTQLLGTQGYAAPEQYGFAQTGARADIYALGAVMNYMKTLHLPAEQLAQGRLRPVIERCTQMDERNRYADIDGIIRALNGNGSTSVVPGFRKNILWHKVVAVAYYLFFFLALLAFMTPTEGQGLYYHLYWVFFVVFVLGAPVPVFTDFLGWSGKLRFTQSLEEKQRKYVPIVTGVICFKAAFMIFIILDTP